MAEIIDGKKIAEKIEKEIEEKVGSLEKKPKLKIFLAGDDPASQIYVQKKKEFCQRVGILVEVENLEKAVSPEEFLEKIEKANFDQEITAILIQLPLPEGLEEKKILLALDPKKDVDCLSPENFGLFCQFGAAEAPVLPVTAWAVMKILKEMKIDLSGQEVVVVGNSFLVGKPLALLLSSSGATVTLCQEKTKDLGRHTRNADILITATGVRNLIKGEMVKKNAVVLDIGINREEGKIFGDVEFASVSLVAGWITPVPGGVGPVTVATLAENILKLRE